jgi:outer membrane biosynthesis protein TonB
MNEFAFETARSSSRKIRFFVVVAHALALAFMLYFTKINPPEVHKKLLVQTVVLQQHTSLPPQARAPEEPIAMAPPAPEEPISQATPTPESVVAPEEEERVPPQNPPAPILKKEKIRDTHKIAKTKLSPKKRVSRSAPHAITQKTTPHKKTPLASPRTTKKKTATAQVDQKEQEARLALVTDALSSIERSQGGASSRAYAVGPTLEKPTPITSLASDSLSLVNESDIPQDPREASYYDELVCRLKLGLRLPEYGPVRVKLTLSRQGQVQKVAVLSARSQKNRDYIKKMLAQMSFPNFGQNFGDEKEHTFHLNLSNELNYQ